jgi:hypothetical protein
MLKRLLILSVLLAGALLVTHAQDNARREIYTVLDYGEDVFEPDTWLVSASEKGARTTAEWRGDAIGALAYLDYIHYDAGIQPDQIPTIFNKDWFDVTLANYQGWREITNCQLGDTWVHEISLQDNNLKYTMRYWVKPVSDTRVLTLFIIFRTADSAMLDDYAEKLFPDAAVCAG